jgi:hypothetical protein
VAQGDILYGSASNTLSALAKNTTATRYLANTGTNNNPAWAQVNLANGVTGTLPTANGGTNLTSFTANGIVYASSTSALATGSALAFDGTNFNTTGDASAASLIPTGAPNSKWAFDGTNSALLITIADNATYDLAVGSGVVYAWDNGGNGVATIYCYYGTTALDFNPAAFYSTTQGTANKINVYYNGTTAYRFENKTGSSKSIYIVTIRNRAAT